MPPSEIGVRRSSNGRPNVRLKVRSRRSFWSPMFTVSAGPPVSVASPKAFPVVVVEDDVAIRGFASHVLRSRGYPVLEAANAELALLVLGTLERGITPILLLDKCLPGMTGLDLIERATGLVEDAEVIMMTAFADREVLLRSMELGVFRCIAKPFHMEELLAAVSLAKEQLTVRRDARSQKRKLEVRNAELERRLKEAAATPRPTAARPREGALPEGLRILFVDDDTLVQRAYRRLFPRQTVQLAPSAEVALEQIGQDAPDIIVCDLHMPEMDGITFYEKLSERHPALAARVVFVSGADIASPRSSRIVPKVPVVKKPFAAADLEGNILALLAS